MLDLIEPSLSGSLSVLAVGGEQCAGLDRVAEGGAGAVGLDHVDVLGASRALASAWRITRSCEGPLGAVRPLEAPSWLTARAPDHGEDRVAVALRVGEALEHEHADALRPAGAVGRLGEGLAAPVGGEAALAAELDEGRRASRAPSPRRPAPACTRRARSAWAARCSATSEEEQAVSTVIAGPSRPSA